MEPEEQLRVRLHGLAERAGRPSADGPGLARRIARDTADRRRSRRNVLIGVGAVVAIAVAVPLFPDTGPGSAEPASGPVSVTGSGPAPDRGAAAAPEDGGIFGGPTRGSLAGDRAFVEGVRLLTWMQPPPPSLPPEEEVTYYMPDPPVETRSVVFAGEVEGERWALVVGRIPAFPPDAAGSPPREPQPDQVMIAWFTGPVGAGPEQMTLRSGPGGIPPDWPLAATDPRTGALVVVAAPGDVVEVSEGPIIGRDGSTTREWRAVETVDGIAITRVSASSRPFDASTSYRVLRDGRTEARDMPWSFLSEEPAAPVPIQYPRGRPTELGERAAQSAAERVLAEVGLTPAQVEVTAQWVGSVPPGELGQAAVVTVTLPSGAVVVEGQVMLPEGPTGSLNGAFCGQGILPAGAPAGRRVQAMSCQVVDYTTGTPTSTSLVVVGPPEVALIRTYDDDRTFLTEHAAVDGVLVVPLPRGTDTVEAVTSAGVTLGRVELLGHTVDFGD
jgi:hypothetical protein